MQPAPPCHHVTDEQVMIDLKVKAKTNFGSTLAARMLAAAITLSVHIPEVTGKLPSAWLTPTLGMSIDSRFIVKQEDFKGAEPAWHREDRRCRSNDRMLVSPAKAAVRLNDHHGSSAGAEVEDLVHSASRAMAGWKVNLKKWGCTECGSEGNYPSHKWCHACGASRSKPGTAPSAKGLKDKDKKAKPDSEKPAVAKADQLSERIRSLQLAKETIKAFSRGGTDHHQEGEDPEH